MKFSLIMPSYLSPYRGSASKPEQKIVRAIESVLGQTFTDWELIVVSDGCERTVEIVKPIFYKYLPKIRLIQIPKEKTWSGAVRNAGIYKAGGDIITFIDTDDFIGENHLKIINDNFENFDWVYYDHLTYNNEAKTFIPYKTNIDVYGRCGTSSVAFKRSLDVYWKDDTYKHDWIFINDLKKASKNYGRIPQTEYTVCHVPHSNPKYYFDV